MNYNRDSDSESPSDLERWEEHQVARLIDRTARDQKALEDADFTRQTQEALEASKGDHLCTDITEDEALAKLTADLALAHEQSLETCRWWEAEPAVLWRRRLAAEHGLVDEVSSPASTAPYSGPATVSSSRPSPTYNREILTPRPPLPARSTYRQDDLGGSNVPFSNGHANMRGASVSEQREQSQDSSGSRLANEELQNLGPNEMEEIRKARFEAVMQRARDRRLGK